MHDTAAAFGAAFFRCYADAFEGARVLEVGAGNVNGTLRGCAPQDCKYTGMDLADGPGVDVVLSDPYTYPFEPASYDIVVSSSCLEHDQMFWLSFAEMCRVLSEGGFIYLNVPSNGAFHRFPTDNWRFYPDSGLALVAWARRNGHDIHLVESFIGRRRNDIWNDCVMVFGKGDTPRQLCLLAELFPRSFNIRIGEPEIISNYCEITEDMSLRAWLTKKFESFSRLDGHDSQTSPIETLLVSLAEREVALDATERGAAERSAVAEAQIASLHSELAAARAAATEAASLHSELAAVRAAATEAARAAVSTGAEIDRLKLNAASLQHEAEERTAALASLRDERVRLEREIDGLRREGAMLQTELAAARQVGRSLLAAVRAGSIPASAIDQPVR
jgi:SAM-dependent methyltransferase